MQVEFTAIVSVALEAALAAGDYDGLVDPSEGPIPVGALPVPQSVMADVCSPVLFILANRAAGRVVPQVSPHQLAEPLLRRLSSNKFFDFHLGTTGHVNASVTNEFRTAFRAALLQGGAELLFSPLSLLLEAKDTQLQPHAQASDLRLFQSEYDRSWRALAELSLDREILRQQVERSDNSDAREVLLKLEMTEWSLDGVIMLLAVLADSEIDASSFLRGLSGRENVPWYLDRFFRESREYLRELATVAGEQSALATGNESFDQVWCRLATVREEIFRSIVHSAGALDRHPPNRQQPERLVKIAVDLVRCFYAFYNRPEWRPGFGRLEPERASAAIPLTKMLRDAVSKLVTPLKNACETPSFTLIR
jgi:hypothetical protein